MFFNTNPNCAEIIKQGKCKADCCGCVPMYERYWERLKKYAQTSDYKLLKFKRNGTKFINAVTKNFKCVFLKTDYSCAIYHSHLRSDICKKYGTNETESLLACPHINEDKAGFIFQYTDKTLKQLAKIPDPAAIELLNKKRRNNANNIKFNLRANRKVQKLHQA